MFIPPYSRDLDPIEQAFSPLKAIIRAKKLRTADGLWKALGDCFTSTECRDFFRNVGHFQPA
jgi:transposase